MKTAKVLWGATDFGAPHFSSDILWRAGFKAPDPFFLVEIDGTTTLLLSPLEIGRAKKEARADRIIPLDSFMKRNDLETPFPLGNGVSKFTEERERDKGVKRQTPTLTTLAWGQAQGLIIFLKGQKIRAVEVSYAFPHGIARMLGEIFTVHDGGHSLYPERARKTKKEIAEITAAQRATENAAAAAVAFLRACRIKGDRVYDGTRAVTSEIIRRIIDDALWKRGYLGSGTIVACGRDATDPHRMGSGLIAPRQPMVMDIFPVSLATHYYADMTRTFFKGEPSEDFARMYAAVLGAQEAAIAVIRAGVDAGAVHRAAAEYLASRGFPTRTARGRPEGFIHGLGHGVGIDIHEAPRLGARSQILEAGNVITIEPGLYYGRASRRVGMRGKIPVGGIRIEDMAVVTKTGCTLLTKFPKDLKSAIIR